MDIQCICILNTFYLTPSEYFSAISWREPVPFWRDDDDDVLFDLVQRAGLDFFNSAILLKQRFPGRHVAPHAHTNPLPSQHVFAFTIMPSA
jgi:hypothetical protein